MFGENNNSFLLSFSSARSWTKPFTHHLSDLQPGKVGMLMIPILQMEKPRVKGAKQAARGHTALQDSNPDKLVPSFTLHWLEEGDLPDLSLMLWSNHGHNWFLDF